jgi:hypothetical protein
VFLRERELTGAQFTRFFNRSFPWNGLASLERRHNERPNGFMHQISAPSIHAFYLTEQETLAPQRILRVVPSGHASKEKLPLASPYPPVR